MMLNRTDFTAAIQAIVNMMDSNFNLEKYLDCNVVEYNHRLLAVTVSLLTKVMGDKDEWIDYWLWELDCGTRSNMLVTEANGTVIPLKTIDDLYNLLVRI